MKQEQRLVAELYRYLAPFFDTSKDVYVSLDGRAALTGVQRGRLSDGTVPDLWFTLAGSELPTRLEAKALDTSRKVLLMQNQLKAWRCSGVGHYTPDLWVAASHGFDAFYLWEQAEFASLLERSRNRQKTVPFSMPAGHRTYATVAELALAVLRHDKARP